MLNKLTEEYDEQSKDKNESEMSHVRQSEEAEKIIKELNDMRGLAKDKIEQLIKQLRQDKLKDHEIKKVLFARVDFVSRPTLYRALPQEFKREYTKPLPKTINISTPHKVIDQPTSTRPPDAEEFIGSPEEEIKKIGEIRRDVAKKEAEEPILWNDEDPKDLEIRFLRERVGELEDALKKTEQFRPANQLTEEQAKAKDMTMEAVRQAGLATPIILTEEMGFEWLAKREDKVSRYWFPNYGIELFRTRILSDLNNRGVKMFKRLYFEV